jgi:hypothetical protein
MEGWLLLWGGIIKEIYKTYKGSECKIFSDTTSCLVK